MSFTFKVTKTFWMHIILLLVDMYDWWLTLIYFSPIAQRQRDLPNVSLNVANSLVWFGITNCSQLVNLSNAKKMIFVGCHTDCKQRSLVVSLTTKYGPLSHLL